MSRSLKRVRAALDEAGIPAEIREMPGATRTAAEAAMAAGCAMDQIAKSIIFRDLDRGGVVLFVTAGGNQVDPAKAARCAGAPLGRADAAFVRAQTSFAIGGVAPVGHLTRPPAFFDPRLLDFDIVWGAAGTPRHVFSVDPAVLMRICYGQVSDFTSGSE